MRTAALIAVLLAGSLVAPAFARPHRYRTGVVEKVVFQERLDSPPVELAGKTGPPALLGFVHLTVRSGNTSYTATMYAYRPDDYPLTLRRGQTVHYRISNEQYIECDVHAVMTMRWATQLTLRDPRGQAWSLEIGPVVSPELPAAAITDLLGKK